MTNALCEYLLWEIVIWSVLMGWIWFVAKLGERKAERERKKRLSDKT